MGKENWDNKQTGSIIKTKQRITFHVISPSTMSGFTTYNFSPDYTYDYFFLSPDNHNHVSNILHELPRVVSRQPVSDFGRAAPWPQLQSLGVAGSQTSPLLLENPIQNPWTRQTISPSPSFPGGRDNSKLTIDEQNKVLKKLKKEIYNPTSRKKRFFRRVSMYYREREKNGFVEMDKLKHWDDGVDDADDGKTCAICLEDFQPSEEVVTTPCNHMFHEGCIEPWIRSHGQCPVCRFALCERMKQSRSVDNDNNMPNASGNDYFLVFERLIR